MLAAAIYVGVVAILLFVIATSIVDVVGQRGEVAEASAMLEQLEGRRPAALGGGAGDVTMPTGSAYLEGATVTVAGAALLQRVAGAVAKFGGNVLSTQLDLQGSQTRAGFLSMIASQNCSHCSTISRRACHFCSSISLWCKPRSPRPVRETAGCGS
jgi:general secretion pathway protein M